MKPPKTHRDDVEPPDLRPQGLREGVGFLLLLPRHVPTYVAPARRERHSNDCRIEGVIVTRLRVLNRAKRRTEAADPPLTHSTRVPLFIPSRPKPHRPQASQYHATTARSLPENTTLIKQRSFVITLRPWDASKHGATCCRSKFGVAVPRCVRPFGRRSRREQARSTVQVPGS